MLVRLPSTPIFATVDARKRRSQNCLPRSWSSRAARVTRRAPAAAEARAAPRDRGRWSSDPPPPSAVPIRPPSSDLLLFQPAESRPIASCRPKLWSDRHAGVTIGRARWRVVLVLPDVAGLARDGHADSTEFMAHRHAAAARGGKARIAGDVLGDQEGIGLGVAAGAAPSSLAPSAKPNAMAVLLSSRAIADPATSRALRASSGPIPIGSIAIALPRDHGAGVTVIATLIGPACALSRPERRPAWRAANGVL